eukprot:m51a1_g9098 hypothetical protein (373) ;mRNA; r:73172-74507
MRTGSAAVLPLLLALWALGAASAPICPPLSESTDTFSAPKGSVTSLRVTVLSGSVVFGRGSDASVVAVSSTRRALYPSLLPAFLSNISVTPSGTLDIVTCLDIKGTRCTADAPLEPSSSSSGAGAVSPAGACGAAAAALACTLAAATRGGGAAQTLACASLGVAAASQALPAALAQGGYDSESACNSNAVTVSVPEDWRGDVVVRTSGASVYFDAPVRAGAVSIETVDGSVGSGTRAFLDAHSCSVATQTGPVAFGAAVSLTVQMQAGQHRFLTVRTGSGDLDIPFIMPSITESCPVSVTSGAGRVSLGLNGFNGHVALSSAKGTVTLDGGLSDLVVDTAHLKNGTLGNRAGKHTLVASSTSGNVVVKVINA